MTNVHDPDPPEEEGAGLAALVASRICHDLVSPLGAVANGLELLLLTGGTRSPELDLIAESVEAATARLRFLRLAFGAASSQPVGEAEVAAALKGLGASSRTRVAWEAGGDHGRGELKAVFLLLLCCEAALPVGGDIRVTREGGAWLVEAASPRLRLDPGAWGALAAAQAPPPGAASQVQFALLPAALHDLGLSLDLEAGEGRILARF